MTSNNENDLFAYLESDCATDLALWRADIVCLGNQALDEAIADFTHRYGRSPDLNDDDDKIELHDDIRERLNREFLLSDTAALHEGDAVGVTGRFSALVEQDDRSLCLVTPGEQDRLSGTVIRMESMPYMAAKWLDPDSDEPLPTYTQELNDTFGVHIVLKDAYVTDDSTGEIMQRCYGDVLVAMNYEDMELRREANVISDQA